VSVMRKLRTVGCGSSAALLACGVLACCLTPVTHCMQAIEKQITDAAEEDKQCWVGQLEKDGSFQLANGATQYTVSSAMVSFKPEERKVSGR
jgi:hypothetical protein